MNEKDIRLRRGEIRKEIGTFQVWIEDRKHELMTLQRLCKHPNKYNIYKEILHETHNLYCPDCGKDLSIGDE